MPKRSKVIIEGKRTYYIYVFVGWEVHVVKNCHRAEVLKMLTEAAGQGQHF